ncbi:MAG: hypothetical protein K9H61_12020 [Bacteroidia bacterium]|nr:hypothetical protein [Bacteroidia bacterium]MCF8447713.1 hypothetical protein [Bacteroidia bacterium]
MTKIYKFSLPFLLFFSCNYEPKNNTINHNPNSIREELALKRGEYINNFRSDSTLEKLYTGLYPGCAAFIVWMIDPDCGHSILVTILKTVDSVVLKKVKIYHTNRLPMQIDSIAEIRSKNLSFSDWKIISENFDKNLYWNLENYKGDLDCGHSSLFVLEGSRDSTTSNKSYNFFKICTNNPGVFKLIDPVLDLSN